jgi:hypothetical protein
MLLALKAARDAINSRPNTPGHFLFIGTGSHRALVHELVTRRNQAFAGATSVAYPVLDGEFVEYLLERLAVESPAALPSATAVTAAFNVIGNRPEELIKALRVLRGQHSLATDLDSQIAVIAATLRTSAADIELMRLDQLGGLATAIFDRIATAAEHARGVFSAEAAAEYSRALGREVRIDEIQPAVNELLAANLIMRRSHGVYNISDPFVQDTWLEKKQLIRAT